MPTLDWIGKKAVVNHHKEIPFHLLKCDLDLSVGESGSDNLLVQGDNLLALKALLPYYSGKVKCIYIDPPYNTGEQTWAYNDNANSPEIREWLGKVVGKEAEDLSRHDKWLCMMYPRMRLLAKFLKPDGFFLVSLNEEEVARFRLLMEEIMPPKSFIASLIWKSRRNLDNRSLHNVSIDHEYVLAYRLGGSQFRGTDKDKTKYSNPDSDPRGPWMSDNLVGLATKERRPNLHYELTNPETGLTYLCPPKGWRYSTDTMAQKIIEGRILWPKIKTGRPRHKKFFNELKSEHAGFSSIVDCGNTNEGTEEVSNIMGGEQFIFPKPRSLIQELLKQTTSDNDIILDSFAGTGTTAHAVWALNQEDGAKRRVVLVELDKHIAKNITRERLKRVIEGYNYTNSRKKTIEVEPLLSGSFRFCFLGEQLFDQDGNIKSSVKYNDLARFVFFKAAGLPLANEASSKFPLIGIHNDTGIYLLYNGVLGDKTPKGGNVLTRSVLEELPHHNGPKIIYGTSCRIGDTRLKANNIAFRQIPYELGVD
jgi:site-specific DNA-methyltransferase (adenine-specific)/adenine-specific DNA-methyltransferase